MRRSEFRWTPVGWSRFPLEVTQFIDLRDGGDDEGQTKPAWARKKIICNGLGACMRADRARSRVACRAPYLIHP